MALEDSLYSFYEFFVSDDLLRDLYQQELLTPLTVSATAIALLGMTLYYYVLNGKRPKYDGMGQWLLVWLVSGVATFLVVLITCIQKAMQEEPRSANPDDGLFFDQGTGAFIVFSLELMVITMLLFFIFSVFLKRWSTHAKIRPFLWPDRIR